MSPRVVRLDDPEALDVSLVGAKAASLARARRAGLAALDGFVVTLAASAEPLQQAATELARRGSGAARMTVLRSDLDETLIAEIAEAAAGLAEPLIARSSSALEGEGTWAGAFASLPELHRDEVPKALRSVWSGMFTLEALERFEAVGIEPGTAGMGVLVQTELAPDCGGAAIVDELGAVRISAVKGSPRDLLAGWVPGVRATVAPDGTISGQEALELIGTGTLTGVAALAREAAGELDCNLTEWAVTGGAPVLLQVQRTPTRPAAADGLVLPAALGHPDARRLARLVIRFPGALGEELVLGWAAAPGFVGARPEGAPVAVGGGRIVWRNRSGAGLRRPRSVRKDSPGLVMAPPASPWVGGGVGICWLGRGCWLMVLPLWPGGGTLRRLLLLLGRFFGGCGGIGLMSRLRLWGVWLRPILLWLLRCFGSSSGWARPWVTRTASGITRSMSWPRSSPGGPRRRGGASVGTVGSPSWPVLRRSGERRAPASGPPGASGPGGWCGCRAPRRSAMCALGT